VPKAEYNNSESGFSLFEILFGLLFISVMAIAITSSATVAMKTRATTIRNAGAMELVIDTLEDFTSRDPANLSDSDDSSTVISHKGNSFTRVVDVTANSDGSKTISVSVTGDTSLGGKASSTITLIDWGAQ
jgi:Tfp pilus assembly protein PilE